MKILFLEANEGTFYLFHRELGRELVRQGHEVIVSVPFGDLIPEIEKIGCECIDAPVKRRSVNPISDLKLFFYYIKLIKKIKPDVILTYTIKPCVYGGMACRITHVPYIADITGLSTAIENKGPLKFLAMTLYKLGLKGVRRLFFENSQNLEFFVKNKLVKNRETTRLVSGAGVNLDENKLEEYLADNGSENKTKFLFVGRIMRNKGINELLEAFKNLDDKNIFLDIVGGCEEDEYIAKLAAAHDFNKNIVYHGLQRNVHEFYKNSHCVILPTYHEGMANVLQEAAAAGRPVIASKIPGCMETFDDGVTGFGCEPKNTKSLENAIKKFLSLTWDERREMGLKGRRKMEREFDRTIVVNAYIEEINKIR